MLLKVLQQWLDETFVSMARAQGPEQRQTITPTLQRERQCPLRRLLPASESERLMERPAAPGQ
ncbi:hypothetical protein [Pseudomaricurvus sp. HS19]|uniref:hypothetical protein n=1 Tax=Pseudomaricurvus sp. HS19 TaxID=2692626 RepID=UPI001370F079|nr:hypothetical protein [Pseudomaricurvus sp. HS19]MYM63012.1 hypothetical protein [Pseudomaricurvus sp. HS19]